jgi:hypothetical protein
MQQPEQSHKRIRSERAPDPVKQAAIAKRLKEAREHRKLDHIDVCRKFPERPGPPDVKALRRWEQAANVFTVADLQALCSIYNYSADWLLGREGAQMVYMAPATVVVDADEIRTMIAECQEVLRRLDAIAARFPAPNPKPEGESQSGSTASA